jgi:hypothetical protein
MNISTDLTSDNFIRFRSEAYDIIMSYEGDFDNVKVLFKSIRRIFIIRTQGF